MLDDATSRLIGDIYAAPVDEPAWQRVLDQILARTGSRFLLVSSVDLSCQQYSKTMWHGAGDGRFLDGLSQYEAEMFRHDPLLAFAAKCPRAGFAESHAALRSFGRSPDDDAYVKFTTGQLGSGRNAVCFTQPRDGTTLGFSINLPAERESFDQSQIQLFRQLFDHIQRAAWLAARPPNVSHSRDPLLLLDSRGFILATSSVAEDILARNDGLQISGRRLHGARPSDTSRIEALIAQAVGIEDVGGGGGAVAVERPSGKPAWLLTADYLGARSGLLSELAATVLIKIVDRPVRGSGTLDERLIKLFAFTPMEAKLINSLYTENLDLRATATRVGLTYATARVHMRHIFAKAEVRNQVELLRLMERLTA